MTPSPPPQTDIGRICRIGMLATLGLFGLALAWANLTPISGAVIASGQVVVPGKPRLVQNLDGGVVRKIEVANGDPVRSGQLLMELDPTLIQAKRDMAMGRLGAALALQDRLEAELSGAPHPGFSDPALPFAAPDMTEARAGQIRIFQARDAARKGRQDQLTERITQINNQIDRVTAQIIAFEAQLDLIEQELANVLSLHEKGLVRETQLLSLQRGQAQMIGDIAGNEAERARLANSIRDARLEVDQSEHAFLEQVSTDLRATMVDVEEMVLEILTLEDQLSRIDIRAPSDGIVHELAVTTEGGVVAPGATIMQIVPRDTGVEFEMKLAAQDLDRTHVGQSAQLVFPALDPRRAPRLAASVTRISPAAVLDEQTGQNFYRLVLDVPPDELRRLGDIDIVPGMPVDSYLQTGERTVMSYLLAPMTHQLMRAFREE